MVFTRSISVRIKRWRLGLRNSQTIEEIARDINPVIRGWINYYGKFNKSTLMKALKAIDLHLIKWVNQKYKKRGKFSNKSKKKVRKKIKTGLQAGNLTILLLSARSLFQEL